MCVWQRRFSSSSFELFVLFALIVAIVCGTFCAGPEDCLSKPCMLVVACASLRQCLQLSFFSFFFFVSASFAAAAASSSSL